MSNFKFRKGFKVKRNSLKSRLINNNVFEGEGEIKDYKKYPISGDKTLTPIYLIYFKDQKRTVWIEERCLVQLGIPLSKLYKGLLWKSK